MRSKKGIIHGPTIALITLFTVISLWIFIKPYANKIKEKNLHYDISSLKPIKKEKKIKEEKYDYIKRYHIIYEKKSD